MSDVTVYGCYGSFCTQKVYLTLAEKGVDVTRRTVNIGPAMENYEPWYARLNPNMVVPTLDHGGDVVCNSSVIIRYIDDNFEGPTLIPDDPGQRAEVEDWIGRIDALRIRELSYGRLQGALVHLRDRIVMPRRLRLLRKYQAQAPDLREVYQKRIDDVEGWIAVMKRPSDLAAMHDQLIGVLDDLEKALTGREFVVGDAYSLADMMATVLAARLRLMNFVDLDDWAALAAHYQRMKKRPRFPADDIAEKLDKKRLLSLVGPFVLPRLALALTVLIALGIGLWWLL